MTHRKNCLAALFLSITATLTALPALAYQHRAVRLGHPTTRFAPSLKTPDDLRQTLQADKLQADITAIAKESGYEGDMEDFRRAAANAPIQGIRIPTGALLPAMSTRRHGQAVLLKEVLWAGAKPIDAYEFFFNSLGRRYRVVTPKACSNFWVEPQARPELALSCQAPAEVRLGQAIKVCQQVKNAGPGLETGASLSLPSPQGATPLEADTGAALAPEQIAWSLGQLPSGAEHTRCVTFTARQRGAMVFSPNLGGELAPSVSARCETRVKGVPAVLLEVVDVQDPVLVGGEARYVLRVLNQGSEPLTNVRLIAKLEPGQRFLQGGGASVVEASADGFTLTPLAVLEPQQEARWQAAVKAEQAGDFRLKVELRVDQMPRPIEETEATLQY